MNRSNFLDYLKGISIFLVVWGHAIQHLDTNYDTSKNGVFMFIYSFHMPLFMTISGYLFAFSSKRKDFKLTINTKFWQLMVPNICWVLIMNIVFVCLDLKGGGIVQNAKYFVSHYISLLPYYLWYLWALFFISIVVSLVAGKLKDKVMLHILAFLLLLCCTDRFGLMYIKFMYPFFLFGYFYNLYRSKLAAFEKTLTYLSFVAFPVLLYFWYKEDLIYHSGMSLYVPDPVSVLISGCKRFAIGFTGIIVVISLIKKVLYFPKAAFIVKMGNLSLGIYIIQTVLFSVLEFFTPVSGLNFYLYTFAYAVPVSVAVIFVSMLLTALISKIPGIGKLLFGGRY